MSLQKNRKKADIEEHRSNMQICTSWRTCVYIRICKRLDLRHVSSRAEVACGPEAGYFGPTHGP